MTAALFLIAAMSVAGLLHSAWLRSPLSRPLTIPIDGGGTFRGRRIFGDNKTIRGFVAIVPGAALSFAALSLVFAPAQWSLTLTEYAILGAVAGLGFMLGELPNSFVKRQLGVMPGETPRSSTAIILTSIMDRLDSILGMLIAVSLTVPTSWATWGWMLLLGPAVHLSFSVLLFKLGVKRRAA
jgi:CDP-2,3-bis-(O-geranylgeranyl)-sn-glycerol synthase